MNTPKVEAVGFTPGPWFQSHRERRDGMWATEVYDAKGSTIATVDWYPVSLPDGVTATAREPNARLIAAAPALYEALTDLMFEDSNKSEEERIKTRIKARLALKSALGE